MELRKFSVERYKGYAELAEVELAPLTLLVGGNDSGKTALAQAIQLLAGGFAASEESAPEPLPLESGGLRHGATFEDLVTGRPVHGQLHLSVTFRDSNSELSLSSKVRNVSTPISSERQVYEWSLRSDHQEVVAARQGFEENAPYTVSGSETPEDRQLIDWRGLVPRQPGSLAPWVRQRVGQLREWASGVRHLRCPRRLLPSPFTTDENPPLSLGPNGENTPLVLAVEEDLRESTRKWYLDTFGVGIDVVAQGLYSDLMVRTQARNTSIRLDQAGRGLSHVLPVVVMALTTRKAGPGVDIIEHPEAELHPAAHGEIAELLLNNLAGPERPLVLETHSEMLLLRARRQIAEGRLPAGDVLIYWVHAEPERGSVLQKIKISGSGQVDSWPEGVFMEDYEEILAIRRAARPKA